VGLVVKYDLLLLVAAMNWLSGVDFLRDFCVTFVAWRVSELLHRLNVNVGVAIVDLQ